jgi:hypothetical protein
VVANGTGAADTTGVGTAGAACIGAMDAVMSDVADTIGFGTAGAIGAIRTFGAIGAFGSGAAIVAIVGAADATGVGAVGAATLVAIGAVRFGVADAIRVGAGADIGISDITINSAGGDDATIGGYGDGILIGLVQSSALRTIRKDDGRWRRRSS